MTSIFSTPDEARCRHYARFAAHLDRAHFDIIYWLLFTLVILMLCMASARYMRSVSPAWPSRWGMSRAHSLHCPATPYTAPLAP